MNIFETLENDATAVGQFIKKEVANITGDASTILPVLDNAATTADNVVNALKTWVVSPSGKLVEDVISAVPGVGTYADDIINFLPTLITGLNWAVAEFRKSPADLLQEGLSYAVNAVDPNIKATNLAVLNAHINTKLSALQNAPISIQGALVVAPVVHQPVTVPVTTASVALPANTPSPATNGTSAS